MLRYNPEKDAEPHFQSFQVPFTDDTSVLQGLQYIKDHLDGSLTFRWSCRMAICGSCGKMVNGKPELPATRSCATTTRESASSRSTTSIVPVIDQSDFLKKLESVKPYIVPREEKDVKDGEYLQTPSQLHEYYQYSQCINCLLCYAACPQYGLKPEFTGPAALALLHRYNADSRDRGWEERAGLLNAEKASGAARSWATAPRCARSTSTRARHQPEQGQQHDGLLRRAQDLDAERGRLMAQVRTYVRPMAGWWRRNPYFVRYMIREGSSVFLAIYTLILVGLYHSRRARRPGRDGSRP